MNYLKLMIPVALLALAGCASKDGASSADGMGAEGEMVDGVNTYGGSDGADGMATAIGDDRDNVVMNDRIVYFAVDSADLDNASMELLKQHQYKPMNVIDQVLSVYAGTRGFLDDVPVEEVPAWEREFLEYARWPCEVLSPEFTGSRRIRKRAGKRGAGHRRGYICSAQDRNKLDCDSF